MQNSDLKYINAIIEIINDKELELSLDQIALTANITYDEAKKINEEISIKYVVDTFNYRLISVLNKLFELAENGNTAAISQVIKIYGLEHKYVMKDDYSADNNIKITIDYND